MNFNELNINSKILKSLDEMGFDLMMPIQENTIPIILEGKNIIGEAETGTGKTAAFVIPILNNIDFKSGNIECLITTPTRELAMQIVTELNKIGKYLNFSCATLVGGMSIQNQIDELRRKPSIVVGTLGRINDHLRGKKLDLSNIRFFVLDEADEMLKEGFKEDIDAINEKLPSSKQTLLFSATISKKVLKLSQELMDSHEFVSVKSKEKQSTNIDQYYLVMKEKQKFSILTNLLNIDNPKSAIIFGRTKRRSDELNDALQKCGFKSACIHGDLSQSQRNTVLEKFRNNKINILVATDVAARGLDIACISHVYNFDLPQEVEYYVHRIGRTGRANKKGISYSFIKGDELPHIHRIEQETKMVIKEKDLPTFEDVREASNQSIIDTMDTILNDLDLTKNNPFVKEITTRYNNEELANILIHNMTKKYRTSDITLTGEPPVRIRSEQKGSRNNSKYNSHKRTHKRKRNYHK